MMTHSSFEVSLKYSLPQTGWISELIHYSNWHERDVQHASCSLSTQLSFAPHFLLLLKVDTWAGRGCFTCDLWTFWGGTGLCSHFILNQNWFLIVLPGTETCQVIQGTSKMLNIFYFEKQIDLSSQIAEYYLCWIGFVIFVFNCFNIIISLLIARI